jgi:DNA replication protein DnaC
MLSVKEMILGYLFYNLSPNYLFYLIYYFFKIKKYVITGDKEITNSIMKKIMNHIFYTEVTYHNGRDQPSGFFIGKKYYGFIEMKEGTTIIMYTKEETYNQLMEQEEMEKEKVIEYKPIIKNKLNVFIRKGTYRNIYYNSLRLDLTHINPIGDQQHVVDTIKKVYNKNDRASIFIHGVTGAGKSTIGYLLAKELNASYCHTFNPTEPGDYLSNLIVDIRTQDDPVVIVIEEVDVLIKKINDGIDKNVEIPIEIYNKTTWNNFMDDLIFYKIVLIFTSNTSKNDIDKLDPSYLRQGRIDEYFYMDKPIMKDFKIE